MGSISSRNFGPGPNRGPGHLLSNPLLLDHLFTRDTPVSGGLHVRSVRRHGRTTRVSLGLRKISGRDSEIHGQKNDGPSS